MIGCKVSTGCFWLERAWSLDPDWWLNNEQLRYLTFCSTWTCCQVTSGECMEIDKIVSMYVYVSRWPSAFLSRRKTMEALYLASSTFNHLVSRLPPMEIVNQWCHPDRAAGRTGHWEEKWKMIFPIIRIIRKTTQCVHCFFLSFCQRYEKNRDSLQTIIGWGPNNRDEALRGFASDLFHIWNFKKSQKLMSSTTSPTWIDWMQTQTDTGTNIDTGETQNTTKT